MQGPIDYWSQLSAVDPAAQVQAALKEAVGRRIAEATNARAVQQQQQLDAARQRAISDPSAKNFSSLFILDPGSHEAIKKAHDTLDTEGQKQTLGELSSIRGYLRAGRPEMATKLIQRRIEADKKAGHDTADDEQMLEMITEDPDGAGTLVDMQLAGIMGPDKWEATFKAIGEDKRAETKLPAEVGKLTAEAAQATAAAGKTVEEAKQVAPNARSAREVDQARIADIQSAIQTRAETLALQRDTLETNVNLELEKLAAKGIELSPNSEKVMTDSVIAAEGSRQLANRANSLAERVTALGAGGTASQVTEAIKGVFGSPTLLRKEYATLINSQAVKNLPPGPASDRDIQLALKGFPSTYSSPETLASFLRGMAKLQTLGANREQGRADWISENGNLGRAKRDLTVNGVKVPAGSTFADFSSSAAAIERREAVGERSYMRFGR